MSCYVSSNSQVPPVKGHVPKGTWRSVACCADFCSEITAENALFYTVLCQAPAPPGLHTQDPNPNSCPETKIRQ